MLIKFVGGHTWFMGLGQVAIDDAPGRSDRRFSGVELTQDDPLCLIHVVKVVIAKKRVFHRISGLAHFC